LFILGCMDLPLTVITLPWLPPGLMYDPARVRA
jgi:hypothetical protein